VGEVLREVKVHHLQHTYTDTRVCLKFSKSALYVWHFSEEAVF
jgi:hypothetical protein